MSSKTPKPPPTDEQIETVALLVDGCQGTGYPHHEPYLAFVDPVVDRYNKDHDLRTTKQTSHFCYVCPLLNAVRSVQHGVRLSSLMEMASLCVPESDAPKDQPVSRIHPRLYIVATGKCPNIADLPARDRY